MDLGIKGKVAVITGADSGMGKETAKILVSEGVHVILSDKNEESLKKAADEVRERADRGGEVVTIAGDLTEPTEITKLADEVKKSTGGAHILAHFAGTSGEAGDFLELSDEDWTKTIEIDLMATVRICRAFIPQLRANGWGRVLLVASENALQPYPEETPYNACKAAVVNLSKGLSKAYAKDGVLINCISPAFIETPMTDEMMRKKAKEMGVSFDEAVEWFLDNERPHIELHRRGKPEEVAAVAALLCSERASFVNGANWRVDGGSVASAF